MIRALLATLILSACQPIALDFTDHFFAESARKSFHVTVIRIPL